MCTKLTIDEANQMAGDTLRVSIDPVDGSLWRVEDDRCVEAHEPMTRSEWSAFLLAWPS